MLEQERAVATRKIRASVRLQGVVAHHIISDLRKKQFLSESDIHDKQAIWQALLRAAIVGIKATNE